MTEAAPPARNDRVTEPPIEPELDLNADLGPEVEPASLGDTVVKGVGLAGAGYVLAQALTLGFYLALAHLATPKDFGVFSAGSLLIVTGQLFTESGMLAALIHRSDRIDEAANTALVATVAGGFGMALLALAAAPLMGLVFQSNEVARIAAAMSGIMVVRSFQTVPEALMQRHFSFLRRVVIQPAGTIGFGVSAVIAASNGLGPWALVIGFYAAAVVDVVLSWALIDWRPHLRQASFSMWKELVGYGRHVLASLLVIEAVAQVPILLIGRFLGPNPLGQFRYASRMSVTSLLVVIQSASYVLFPVLSRITSDRDRFRSACMRSLRMMCAVAFPLSMSLLPLGVPSALIFFGEVWKQAGYAAMALTPLPVAGAMVAFSTEVFKADGRPSLLAKMQLIILVSGSIAMVALLPLGLVGVCLGVGVGSIAGAVYALLRTDDLLEVPIRKMLREMWPQGLAALIMAAVMVPVEFLVVHAGEHGTALGCLLLGGEGLMCLGLYMAALFVLAPTTARDLISLTLQLAMRGKVRSSSPVATTPG